MRGAIIGLAAGVVLGFILDDPGERVETVTVTETETVEVPGPEVVRYETVPLPDSCARMVTILGDAYANIEGYSAATERDAQSYSAGIRAVASGDYVRINQSIDDMHNIEFEATTWASNLDANIEQLAVLQPQCAADAED